MVVKLLPLSVDDLLNLDTPRKEWHVEGLFSVGQLVLLSAREKSGKGLICIDLAASIAEGSEFLGMPTLQGKAVYLAAEEPIDELQERVTARLGDNQDVPFHIVHLDGSSEGTLDLTKQEDAHILDQFVVENGVSFLIIDVLREIHSAQEDSSTEMSQVMKHLRNIAHIRRCTIIVTHHESKSGGSRGSTAIAGGVDVIMQMITDTNSSHLEGTLSANGRGVPKIEMNIQFGDDARWIGTLSKGTRPSVKQTAEEKIARVLMSANVPMSVEQIVDSTKVSKSTASNTMTKLSEKYPLFLDRTPGPGKGSPMQYKVNPANVPATYGHLLA